MLFLTIDLDTMRFCWLAAANRTKRLVDGWRRSDERRAAYECVSWVVHMPGMRSHCPHVCHATGPHCWQARRSTQIYLQLLWQDVQVAIDVFLSSEVLSTISKPLIDSGTVSWCTGCCSCANTVVKVSAFLLCDLSSCVQMRVERLTKHWNCAT